MRTKTLLIAAASALAAAVTSAQAQTVYSQNIVGYVNLGITGGNQYQLYSPALDVDGTGTNGTISTLLGNNVDVGTVVYAWNGASYDSLVLQTSGRGSSATTNWVLEGVGNDPTYKLNVGEGFFITDPNPTATITNITETGVVMQGTLLNPYIPAAANAYGLVSSIVPVGGDLVTNLNYHGTPGDVIYQWNGSAFNAFAYQTSGRGSSATTNWVLEGVGNQVPQISVGSGFFLVPAANNETWTETFTNN